MEFKHQFSLHKFILTFFSIPTIIILCRPTEPLLLFFAFIILLLYMEGVKNDLQ